MIFAIFLIGLLIYWFVTVVGLLATKNPEKLPIPLQLYRGGLITIINFLKKLWTYRIPIIIIWVLFIVINIVVNNHDHPEDVTPKKDSINTSVSISDSTSNKDKILFEETETADSTSKFEIKKKPNDSHKKPKQIKKVKKEDKKDELIIELS